MAYSGLSTITIEQILEDVSFTLVEPIVNTTLGTGFAVPGSVAVTPGSMAGIYTGAQLIIALGQVTQEQVTVTGVTSTTFTAVFLNPHLGTDSVIGATFPSGQTVNPLFTQNEIIGYLADVQNDFLLKTRCIFEVTGSDVTPTPPGNIALVVNNRFYPQPSQVIRVERVAAVIPGQLTTDLYDTTQSDLDLDNSDWPANSNLPKRWFRDQIDTAKIGLDPSPNVGGSLELWYSKRGPTGDVGNLKLYSLLLIPDVMSHYIKYGILAKCWSKDGETRDPMRSEYCKKRFEFGVVLVQRFMEGIGLDTGAAQQSFSPMAVPAGSNNG